MQIRTKNKVYTLAMTAMMAAVIAAVSPFAIPIGPTPITLCTLALYFSPYILGWKRAALATLVYILLGMVGVPVFSGFKAGLGHPHPTEEILVRYRQLGGEILTVGSDAHTPAYVGYEFDRVQKLLRACGFRYYTVFHQRKPVFLPL